MIKHALLIALTLSAAGCGKPRGSAPAGDSTASRSEAKPFTLKCDGEISDDIGRVVGPIGLSLTVDAANSEALISAISSTQPGLIPPMLQKRSGDIIKLSTNERELNANLNDGTRAEVANLIVDRRTGKFNGPDIVGTCVKAELIPMPGQKF